jgi:hypothetical protein
MLRPWATVIVTNKTDGLFRCETRCTFYILVDIPVHMLYFAFFSLYYNVLTLDNRIRP